MRLIAFLVDCPAAQSFSFECPCVQLSPSPARGRCLLGVGRSRMRAASVTAENRCILTVARRVKLPGTPFFRRTRVGSLDTEPTEAGGEQLPRWADEARISFPRRAAGVAKKTLAHHREDEAGWKANGRDSDSFGRVHAPSIQSVGRVFRVSPARAMKHSSTYKPPRLAPTLEIWKCTGHLCWHCFLRRLIRHGSVGRPDAQCRRETRKRPNRTTRVRQVALAR